MEVAARSTEIRAFLLVQVPRPKVLATAVGNNWQPLAATDQDAYLQHVLWLIQLCPPARRAISIGLTITGQTKYVCPSPIRKPWPTINHRSQDSPNAYSVLALLCR